jgi:DNA-binding NarL/FixJ family response regulator
VLVVDDYEPFRRFVCSTLEQRPDLQIIGEAADGLEAVHKAEELQPDLIVLDIGLPTLNGIGAARRIRELSPESKILFVSQESSADLVQESLRIGALGYVVKTHAGIELSAAVEAVRQGKQFISIGLSGHNFASTTDAQAPVLCHEEAVSSFTPGQGEIARKHEVQFYSDESAFLVGFTRFIEAALKAENAVIVVATEPHRVSLLQRLHAGGGEVAAGVEQKHYIPLNVADTLSTFMVDGLIDPVRFANVAGDLLAEAAKEEHHHVALC